jgi:hypothetical protein
MPFTMNVRTLYRGTGAAILSECQQMGLQFLFTGMTKKIMAGHAGKVVEGEHLSPRTEFAAAAVGGLLSSFFTTPVELLMIQQQKFGGSLVGTCAGVIRTHGITSHGMMRGLMGAASRDAIYVAGMLGVTPVLREYIMRHSDTQSGLATLYASLLGGVAAAVPSHPFDVIKTCMQVRTRTLQCYSRGCCGCIIHVRRCAVFSCFLCNSTLSVKNGPNCTASLYSIVRATSSAARTPRSPRRRASCTPPEASGASSAAACGAPSTSRPRCTSPTSAACCSAPSCPQCTSDGAGTALVAIKVLFLVLRRAFSATSLR